MAWDVLKEPFPGYHPAVGPEVPRPDNTAANLVAQGGEATGRLIAAGTDTAIGAFIRAAIARKDAELQAQKLVQDSALTLRGQDIQQENNRLDYLVGKQNADSLGYYRRAEGMAALYNAESRNNTIQSGVDAKAAAEKNLHDYATSVNTNDKIAQEDLNPIVKSNLVFDNPGAFLVQGNDWITKHGSTKVGATAQSAKALQDRLNSLTIPYIEGAEYVTKDGKSTGKPGELAWRVPAAPGSPLWIPAIGAKQVSLQQIYNLYQDETNRQSIQKGVIAAGHGKIVQSSDPNSKNNTITTPTLDKWATNVFKAFEAKRPPVEDQTPTNLKTSVHPLWSVKAGVGAQDNAAATGELDPQQANDQQWALHHVQQDPANKEAYRQRYLELYPGSDTSFLDQ